MRDQGSGFSQASSLWHRVSQGFLDALYPRVCRHCDELLPAQAPRRGLAAWICPSCQDELTPIEPPYCSVCGEPFAGPATSVFRCSNCQGRRIAFDFACSGFKAEGPLREMIHSFKYGKDLSLRAALVDVLQHALTDPRLADEDLLQWLLVPVPLHWTRQVKRGFNQSWELCRLLSKSTHIPTAQILRRRVMTRTQTRLERHRRLANLRKAFSLRRSLPWFRLPDLRGRKIFLVDDVLTTGATAHECAKILKREGGAEKVVVITAARG
ncbi:comF family protein [Prosthecobacter debontii]|uniref:ComF family protein n=1 Tax=Prosthecobacter debontii TaxID=48467 RepID=A0A1T4WVH5_9BACT|nr:ComF family protein [Prosthecobacter debontii]SKA81353.1 comF family protein [Prosthecobacter debontii]